MDLRRSETLAEQAYNLLRRRGVNIGAIFYTPKLVRSRNDTRHLFRGKVGDATLRFEGIVANEKLMDLREISTSERKKIGKGTDGTIPERKASAVRSRAVRRIHILAMSLVNYTFWAERDPGEGYGEVIHRLARDPKARKDVIELYEPLPYGLSDKHAVEWIHGMLFRAGLSRTDPWVVCNG
jgi:hypothetical protein